MLTMYSIRYSTVQCVLLCTVYVICVYHVFAVPCYVSCNGVDQVAAISFYFMLIVLGTVKRMISTMIDGYLSGSASIGFVTVPSMDVGKRIAR